MHAGHGGAAAHAFVPTDLAAMAAWYRADVGVTQSGGLVSLWADQSGNGRDLTAAGGARPGYAASGIGGLPSLSFDGLAQYIAIGGFGTVAIPFTVYAVAVSTAQDAVRVIFDGAVGSTHRPILYHDATSLDLYNGSNISVAGSATSARAWCGVFNGASSALYVDNSQTAIVSGNAGSDGLDSIEIGGSVGMSNLWKGQIAEVILYVAAHNAATRLQVIAYLGTRYGITVS